MCPHCVWCPVSDLTPDIKQAIRDSYSKLAALPNFTTRRSQREMIALVAEALATNGVAAIQAPTGTGKSIAALLPAVPVADANARKIVVSTATISLQEQYERDIPRLLEIIGYPGKKVALAKGRQRYLCTRQLIELIGNPQPNLTDLDLDPAWPRPPRDGEVATLEALSDAIHADWNGDLDAAPTPVSSDLRPLLTTTASACGGKGCPFADRCGYLAARAQVEAADIVITNHDLLLADLGLSREDEDGQSLPGGVLLSKPEESYYLIDEAHHLAAKAAEADSIEVHLTHVPSWLRKGRKAIAAAYRILNRDNVRGHSSKEAQDRLIDLTAELKVLADTLAQQCLERLDRQGNLRFKSGKVPEALQESIDPIRSDILLLHAIATDLAAALRKSGNAGSAAQSALRSIGHLADRLQPIARWASDWTGQPIFPESVPVARWLSKSDRTGIVLRSQPCEGRALLKTRLWSVCDGIVLTSATLAIGDDFGHFAYETALPQEATLSLLSSPFNLSQQGHLRIPPVPTLPNDPGHPQSVASFLDRGLDPEGGSLVLFTSRAKMRATFDLLAPDLRQRVLMQGDRPLSSLLEAHRERVQSGMPSILFGLQSMGEGLDLAGDLCRTVVITGLPFAPPDDPVLATHAEYIESDGGDPFAEITIPRVILMLVQWCGRLIRTHEDTGEIVILDNRLKTKRYGRQIIAALPPFTRDDR